MPNTASDADLLLVVDVQNDFLPGGALAVADGHAVVPVINRLAGRFANVAVTQDWHPGAHASFASAYQGRSPFERIALPYGEQVLWPDHCVQETQGAALASELRVGHAQLVIRKGYHQGIDSYSAFREADRQTPTGLSGYLRERGIGRVFLTGLATDFCVAFSALDAIEAGFQAVVIEDACRGIDLDGSLQQAWDRMRHAGVGRARSDAPDLLG